MKVILTQNVPGLGQKDDTKEVKPGYWRNYLLLNNQAVLATPELLKETQKKKEDALKKKETEEKKVAESLVQFKDKILEIEARSDEKGNLFAGIGVKRVAKALKNKMQIDVSPEVIKIKNPIKKIGEHEVLVKDAALKIEVKSE